MTYVNSVDCSFATTRAIRPHQNCAIWHIWPQFFVRTLPSPLCVWPLLGKFDYCMKDFARRSSENHIPMVPFPLQSSIRSLRERFAWVKPNTNVRQEFPSHRQLYIRPYAAIYQRVVHASEQPYDIYPYPPHTCFGLKTWSFLIALQRVLIPGGPSWIGTPRAIRTLRAYCSDEPALKLAVAAAILASYSMSGRGIPHHPGVTVSLPFSVGVKEDEHSHPITP
jgi:hypothetical protein